MPNHARIYQVNTIANVELVGWGKIAIKTLMIALGNAKMEPLALIW